MNAYKPIIAISMPYLNFENKLNTSYFHAVGEAGGISLIITPKSELDSVINVADGIILSGGGDFHGDFLGEDTDKRAKNIDYERDKFEIEICKKAFYKHIPILGICRGAQVIAISLGGKILQHIDGHVQKTDKSMPFHAVKVLEDSILFSIIKSNNIEVNSFHHQCVYNIPDDFIVSAQSYDGIIEAFECKKQFCMGIQWHPEAMIEKNCEDFKIFEYFINICHKNS